ncbi:hypothetical protein ACLOJK_015005 [Asimina triloba]
MRASNCLPIVAGKDAYCDESSVRDLECMPVASPCDIAGGGRDVETGSWSGWLVSGVMVDVEIWAKEDLSSDACCCAACWPKGQQSSGAGFVLEALDLGRLLGSDGWQTDRTLAGGPDVALVGRCLNGALLRTPSTAGGGLLPSSLPHSMADRDQLGGFLLAMAALDDGDRMRRTSDRARSEMKMLLPFFWMGPID